MSGADTYAKRSDTRSSPQSSAPLPAFPLSRYEVWREKALELFALRGFGQVSMRDLASHLGLTAGTLYHHFPSKQHLLFDLLEEFYEEMATLFCDCTLRVTRGSGQDALKSLIHARLALHQEHPYHSRIALRDTAGLEGEFHCRIQQMKREYEEALLNFLEVKPKDNDHDWHATGQVLGEIITGLPDWLENHPLSDLEKV